MAQNKEGIKFGSIAERDAYIFSIGGESISLMRIDELFYEDGGAKGYWIQHGTSTVGDIELEQVPSESGLALYDVRITHINITDKEQRKGFGTAAHLLVCAQVEYGQNVLSDSHLTPGSVALWQGLVQKGVAQDTSRGIVSNEGDYIVGRNFATDFWLPQ